MKSPRVPRIIVALTIEAVGEALLFAAKAGADPAKVREALMGGFAYHNAAPNADRKKDATHGEPLAIRSTPRPHFVPASPHMGMQW